MNRNASSCIKSLWEEGFFEDSQDLRKVSNQITAKWGHNFYSIDISKALHRASYLKRSGTRGAFDYKQKVSPKGKKMESIEGQLFSKDLIAKFGDRFKVEIDDLKLNFGRSGVCTAFLLRKILEKAIFLVFATNGLVDKLETAGEKGYAIGLQAMLDIAAREKIKGISILIPKTADSIKGIKFLGDTSAHNPLVNVDMETVLPQMPFIITAYKELVERL